MVGDTDSLAFVRITLVGNVTGDAEGGGMEWCLRDEPVRERDAQEPGNKCSETKQPDVPMKSGGFTKRKLGSLGDQR